MSIPYKRLNGAALVTGAGSGIGQAVSIAMAAAGISTIFITDINSAGLDSTASAITSLGLLSTPHIIRIPGDISSPEFIASLFGQLPSLDYAVNCAGVSGQVAPTAEVSLEDFDRLNGVNYRGLWMCVKEELKLMLRNDIKPYHSFTTSREESLVRGQRGAIVNIASQLGLVGKTQAAIYTASKAAVLSLTRSDAIDYSKPPHHIRINSVCPGVIATPMTTSGEKGASEKLKAAIKMAPMARIGLASEIADAAVWLCSGESSFVTGTGLVVDGGYVIN
ncbi:oxidoreductase [Pleomassaria siparia CBS 279.74]|uniref:Oxidoreductase n=1 Tax=Pleomassaria siparia CBS 279.74 TaxID=1314801 RepID=A0A6G1JT90_9PLEO|nr:oxidoreductase [Pleomassaria siparia CBS 279.74]